MEPRPAVEPELQRAKQAKRAELRSKWTLELDIKRAEQAKRAEGLRFTRLEGLRFRGEGQNTRGLIVDRFTRGSSVY